MNVCKRTSNNKPMRLVILSSLTNKTGQTCQNLLLIFSGKLLQVLTAPTLKVVSQYKPKTDPNINFVLVHKKKWISCSDLWIFVTTLPNFLNQGNQILDRSYEIQATFISF